MAHFGSEANQKSCDNSLQIINSVGNQFIHDSITIDEIKIGNTIPVGPVSMDLAEHNNTSKTHT